jgi:predicted signal transduction protein with EAL and GGDEF domain
MTDAKAPSPDPPIPALPPGSALKLLALADAAMYSAKAAGRNRFFVFDPSDEQSDEFHAIRLGHPRLP